MTMDPKPTATRRQFIATTTAAAWRSPSCPGTSSAAQRFVAPSDKVNVALIGAGGQGRTNARALFPGGGLPGHRARRSRQKSGTSRKVVLRRQGGQRSAKAEVEKHYSGNMLIYTCPVDQRLPGHAGGAEGDRRGGDRHARPPARVHRDVAIKTGKHVYCEKPLTHSVRRG